MPTNLDNLSDSALLDVAQTLVTAAGIDPAAYNTTLAEVSDLESLRISFDASVADQQAKIAAAKAATATKESNRTPLIEAIRQFRDIAKAHGASESAMAALGLPSGGGAAAPANATVPVGSVDTSKRLQHTISWFDSPSPDNKKRPRGVMGCEIYVKIDGPPPTDEKQCTFLTVDSQTPYIVDYDGDDAGKMAHYLLRWRMRDGSTTAWGETVSATITG